MAFTLRFVASDVRPVFLDPDDASVLADQLEARFQPDRLGLPDLLGRLRDGARDGEEVTVDERQAEELFLALGAESEESGGDLSPGLLALRAACEQYLAP